MRAKKQVITGPMMQEKALQFGKEMGKQDFTASNGWLHRFKKRNGICYKTAHGEKASCDEAAADEFLEARLADLLEQYDADAIYNADETGLYLRAMPDGSLCFAKEKLMG